MDSKKGIFVWKESNLSKPVIIDCQPLLVEKDVWPVLGQKCDDEPEDELCRESEGENGKESGHAVGAKQVVVDLNHVGAVFNFGHYPAEPAITKSCSSNYSFDSHRIVLWDRVTNAISRSEHLAKVIRLISCWICQRTNSAWSEQRILMEI